MNPDAYFQYRNFPYDIFINFSLYKSYILKKFSYFCRNRTGTHFRIPVKRNRIQVNYIKNMKKKILILDDKETIAKVLSIYLMSDYDVQWLPNGLEGVEWLQDGNTPDLIISDIRMPKMRGDDFLEWIKQNELFRHIPVIMLSSEDSTSERIRLLEIGAEDYIVKPFNPMELKIKVKKILS